MVKVEDSRYKRDSTIEVNKKMAKKMKLVDKAFGLDSSEAKKAVDTKKTIDKKSVSAEVQNLS